MKFKLSFRPYIVSSYPMMFSYIQDKLYTLYFYGFSVDDIVKYTPKYVEFSVEEQNYIIREVLKYVRLKELKTRKTIFGGIETDVSVDKLVTISLEAVMTEEIIRNIKLHGLEMHYVRDIIQKVYKYVETLIQINNLKRIYKSVEICTDISKPDVLNKIVSDNVIELSRTLSICGVIPDLSREVSISKDKIITKDLKDVTIRKPDAIDINTEEEVKGRSLIEVEPLAEIKTTDPKAIESILEVDIKYLRVIEKVSIEGLLGHFRKGLAKESKENLRFNNSRQTEFTGDEMDSFFKNKGMEDTLLEIVQNKIKSLSGGFNEVRGKSLQKQVTIDSPDVNSLKYKGSSPSTVEGSSGYKTNNMDIEYPVELEKKPLLEIETTLDISNKLNKFVTPVLPIEKPETAHVDTLTEVDTKDIISVAAVVEVKTGEYKDLRFGRRWRFKTGRAFDKIWLNPTGEELAVEGKISFKAMLDFILFVEQLMYVNRYFYAASRAVTAIDDIVRVLEEWIAECRPTEELPVEYEYLVRWYKWWADGERNEHINDMELNGLAVLEAIRDKMVVYFESRWGKRVVKYGPDGMYIYSEDYSYIDRIRGKKHGYAHREVNRNMMKDEYGFSEKELEFDVETEQKGKRNP